MKHSNKFETHKPKETYQKALIEVDANLEIYGWSKGAHNWFGFTSEEILGKPIGNLFGRLDGLDPEKGIRAAADLLADGKAIPVKTRSGSLLVVDVVPYLLDVAGNQRLVIACRNTSKPDDTQAHIRMKQLKAVADLGMEAGTFEDVRTTFRSALVHLHANLPIEYAMILRLEPESDELVLESGLGWEDWVVEEETRVGIGVDSQAHYTLKANEPVIVDDLGTDDRFSGSEVLTSHKVVSGMSLVIQGEGGRPYGVMGVYSRTRRNFKRDDVQFLRAIANILSEMVVNRKAIEDIEKSTSMLEAIVQHSPSGIVVLNTSKKIIYANENAAKIMGVSSAKEMRNTGEAGSFINLLKDFQFFNEEGKKIPHDNLPGMRVIQGLYTEPMVVQITDTKAGWDKWIRIYAQPIFDRDKQLVAVVNFSTEITQQIREKASWEFLSHASQMLTKSLDYRKTLLDVVNLAVPKIADWCTLELLSEDGELQLVEVANLDKDKQIRVRKLLKTTPVSERMYPALSNVLNNGMPLFVPDINDEAVNRARKESEYLSKVLKEVGVKSAMLLPLVDRQNQTIGYISFVISDSRRQLNYNDFAMASQLASMISVVIENAKHFQESKRERERLMDLIQTAPGVVWEAVGDPGSENQQFTFVSKHAEEILGYSQKEWLETPNFWLKVVHPEDQEIAALKSSLHFRKGTGGVVRFRWLKKSGESIWVEAQTYVIHDRSGSPIGLRGITMDISERMEVEVRKNDFISMASHELKTPLTSLNAYTQILEKLEDSEKHDKASYYLDKSKQQIKRLQVLIEDLLDVSKIQQGRLNYDMNELDVNAVVEGAVENMRETTKSHRIELRGNVKSRVLGDSERIGQVMFNLLSNAIKYSPEKRLIKVRLAETDDEVVVSVIDQGVGIALKHQAQIFEQFYRVTDDKKIKYPGLGIGLYISNQIANRHGGKLEVVSEVGHGSTFSLVLPIYRG